MKKHETEFNLDKYALSSSTLTCPTCELQTILAQKAMDACVEYAEEHGGDPDRLPDDVYDIGIKILDARK